MSGAPTFHGSAYPPAWRVVAALLRTVGGVSLPLLFSLLLTRDDPPLTPPLLLRLFLIWAAAPACAAWLIRRAFTVAISVEPTEVVLLRRDLRIAIPIDAIQHIAPWRVPLPGPGLALHLRSGQRFRWGVALDDPSRLLTALSGAVPDAVRSAMSHPMLVYARARPARAPHPLRRLLAKFPGFALLPATVLFYTHQSIAHGGPFGEYYTFGLAAYLTTYAVYWSTVTIYMILYASIWRAAAESAGLLAAWLAPARAVGVRRWSERGCALLYYAGVPAILALRYMG